jgi:hypothetical protein
MDWIDKLIEQAPWAAALTILVVFFLRYQIKREDSYRSTVKELIDDFREQAQSCCNAQIKAAEVMERSAIAMEASSQAVSELHDAMQEMKGVIQNCHLAALHWRRQAGEGLA